MSSPKEIKNQVLSIKKIQKITDVMQKIAASKMRRAHQRMEKTMPYATKIREVLYHITNSDTKYDHIDLQEREQIKRVGYAVVTTDRGLCGGLNINLCKTVWEHAQQFYTQNIAVDWYLFGEKSGGFFQTLEANVVAHTSHLGEKPKVADLVSSIQIMLAAYKDKQLDRLFIANNEFISTIVQKPKIKQILPLPKLNNNTSQKYNWDYIYEPAPKVLLNSLIIRYVEAQLYQAVVDNLACEQVARMLAMQNATNSAKELIEDLQLMYNKARQATITQEIAEIMGGISAV